MTLLESSTSTDNKPINGKQLRFVEEYLVDFNGQAAARRAGYCERDSRAGNRLLKIPKVRAEINRRCVAAQVRLQITGDDVRQGFAQIAFDTRLEGAGGPTRMEKMFALDRLAKMFGLYQFERPPAFGSSLEQLLAAASALESSLPPATPPLRLVQGGKL